MRIFEILQSGRKRTRGVNVAEAEILLCHSIKKPREFLLAHPEFSVLPGQTRQFRMMLRKRASGIPMAYLTHHREFFNLDFYVDGRVLIPRPETELLVEEVIRRDQGSGIRDRAAVICDIGTGSGCIAVALAKNLPHARFLALDVSADALKVAKKNAKIHSVTDRITFLQSDLLASVMVSLSNHDSSIGLVANLPYIGENENHLVGREVLDFEPKIALFGGKTGVEMYEKLFQQIAGLSSPPAWFIFEFGFLQKRLISKLIKKYFGNPEVLWKTDLAGLDRVCVIDFR